MLNRGLLDQIKKVREELQEKAKSSSKSRFPRILRLTADEPNFITFLHGFDKSIPLEVHYGSEDNGYRKIICDKIYGEECSMCPEDDEDNNWKKKSICIRNFIGYAHNLDGDTFDFEGNTYPVNPVQIVEVRAGKSGKNHNELQDEDRQGYLTEEVHKVMKKGEKKKTEYIYSVVPRKVLGDQFPVSVPSEILDRYLDMPIEAIAIEILSNYDNVKEDIWGIEIPKSSTDDDEDDKPKSSGKASKRLNS